MKKIFSPLIFLLLIAIISPLPIKASVEFKTKNIISYEIGPRGDANVSQKISLTNNFSNIYPREYQLEVEREGLENISAYDQSGEIIKKITEEEEKTKIQLAFNEEVVGKGKTLNFEINYSIPQFAKKRGQVWEATIPGLLNPEEIEQIEIEIKTPISFGELSYSSQTPREYQLEGNQQIIRYQKSQINEKPLLVAFGEFQIFDFSLTFFLKNSNPQEELAKIPIPPDTAYQSVIFKSIDPLPKKVELDQDFNWLAIYNLNPNENKEVRVSGQAKIFPRPENLPFLQVVSEKINPDLFLKEDQYWEVNHATIKDLAENLKTPKKIQSFVIDHLKYNLEDIDNAERLGALKAYQLGKGVCTEFSDLFVAIARSAKIPSREIEGFAFTENQKLVSLAAKNDVLHSWVEYWDEKKRLWIPLDPTLAKTVTTSSEGFDLGHFAFVIHGLSSDQPPPPGFYKTKENQRNVQVDFSDQLILQPKVILLPRLEDGQNNFKVKILNTSLAPAYQTNVQIKGRGGKELIIPILPPLGEEEILIIKPNFFQSIFSKPVLNLIINQSSFTISYPKPKLNFWSFFANLF